MRIAQRGGALQLQRLFAVRRDLHGDAFLLGGFADLFCEVRLAEHQRQLDGLDVVERSVVVAGTGFGATVLAREQPVQVSLQPGFEFSLVFRCPRGGACQQLRGVCRHCDMPSLQNTRAATRVFTGHGLRKIQVGVHPRRRVQKPDPQAFCRTFGVSFIAGKIISQRQRLDGFPHQADPAVIEPVIAAFRIHFAIMPDVRQAVRFRRIRPEVRRRAHVVMPVATGWHFVFLDDRWWRGCQRLVRLIDQGFERGFQGFVATRQPGFHFHQYPRTDAIVTRCDLVSRCEPAEGENEKDAGESASHRCEILGFFSLSTGRKTVLMPSLETLAIAAGPVS